MNRPIRALIPGARGALLDAMICAGHELSTAQAARVAGVSGPQASRVLAQLVELGIVRRREVPPAVVYAPVESNLVVAMLRDLCNLRDRVIWVAVNAANSITPRPTVLSLYGSVARGTSDADSDIDVVAVRPDGADNDDTWVESLDRWRVVVQNASGNPVNIIDLTEEEWRARDLSSGTLWHEIDRDAVLLLSPSRVPA